MKTYIRVWIIIACIVSMGVFSYLAVDGGSNIRCNRYYRKVYPCNTNYAVSAIYDPFSDDFVLPSSYTYHEPEEPKISWDNPVKEGSDLAIIFGALVCVNLLLAGIAVLLYFVLLNLEEYKYQLSSIFSLGLIAFIGFSGFVGYKFFKYIDEPGGIKEIHYNAPIIYLYDDLEREATVKLDFNGDLTCTYPRYDAETGWVVKTSADGVLTDAAGRQYEYLYWEADVDMDPDFSKGFCVRGEDSAAFLEKALSDLGLSDTEANTFIMYWLPQLEANPYNVIAFQGETYENVAKLDVDPLPDTVVRVNMLFYGSDEYVEMVAQDLTSMNPALSEREGFVLVEWGGGYIG